MSKEAKQARRFRKTVKKIIRSFFLFFVLLPLAAILLIMNYSHIQALIDRITAVSVDGAEVDRYYNLLLEYETPGKTLVHDLGVSDAEHLSMVLNKLKSVMGMEHKRLKLEFKKEELPPGNIHKENDELTIFISTALKKRREQINVLVHELGHVYVWDLAPSQFGFLDQEKLVDVSGIFLGLGIFTLNGLTDHVVSSPDGRSRTEQKTFGYLKPEQFGYLMARYAAEHGIPDSDVKAHLNEAGRKYYHIGSVYLRRKTQGTYVPEPVLKAQAVIRKLLGLARQKLADAGIKLPEFPRWERVVAIP